MRCWTAFAFGVALLTGCHGSDRKERPFRLGFFPNLTHAQALIGTQEGEFARALGTTRLEVKKFSAGPAAMEALLGGAVDVSYVGGGPAVIAYVRSQHSVRVIAGSASGGSLLISHTARTAAELEGKRVAAPQLGNSQDIALRHWLEQNGLKASDRGGTVQVLAQSNPDIVTLFRAGQIEAAWVPEPWATRLLLEAGGRILVDERTLWPSGSFPTTALLATQEALMNRRESVKAILRVHLRLTDESQSSPDQFSRRANAAFTQVVGSPLSIAVLRGALMRIEFAIDPLPAAFEHIAANAAALGYVPADDFSGLVDRTLLDEVLGESPRG